MNEYYLYSEQAIRDTLQVINQNIVPADYSFDIDEAIGLMLYMRGKLNDGSTTITQGEIRTDTGMSKQSLVRAKAALQAAFDHLRIAQALHHFITSDRQVL